MSFGGSRKLFALLVLIAFGFASMNAHGSSLIELIGGDPTVQPRAPNPTIIFSSDAKKVDGGKLDPSGKQLRIEMWVVDPITGALIPIYEGLIPPEYVAHHGKKSLWTLTHEGKVVTGIEQLQIRRVSDDTVSIRFKDSGIPLPDIDYSNICFRVWIGPDDGQACYGMVLQGRSWHSAS